MLERVFLQVLRLSVLAGPLFVAIVLMRLALRRAPRWICCALWGLLALRLVCPFSLPSPLSLQPSQARVDQVVADVTRARIVYSTPGYGSPGYRWTEFVDGLVNADAEAAQPPVPVTPDTSASEPVTAAEAAPQPEAPSAGSWAKPLSILWLAGAAVMVLYGAGSYLRLHRRVRTAVRWKENLWQCETVDAPFVLGVFRPRIYLPFHMDPVAAAQVIAHERAHIKRHDQLTKVFAWLLLSAYWFHWPLWGAYALLCRDIELACDERVIRDMSAEARQRYARALLDWGAEKPAAAACPLAFGEVGLKERIKTVMKYKKPARWAAVLAVALIAASGVCLLTSPMAEAVTPAQSAPFTADAENEQTPAPAASGIRWDTPESQFAANMVNIGLAPYVDPDEAPESFPILTVRPRAVTADETKALAEAVFGDAPIYEYTEAQTKQELAGTIASWERRLSSIDVVKAEVTGDDDEAARAYIEEFTPLLEAYRAAYETAPDKIEPQPADWTFHPDSYYRDQGWQAMGGIFSSVWDFIMVTSERDGLPYKLRAENYDGDDPEDKNIRIHYVTILPDDLSEAWDALPAEAAPLSLETFDSLCAQARDILTAAGLDRYAVAFADLSTGRITALPVYEGKPLFWTSMGTTNPDVPEYGGVNAQEEGVGFKFEGGRLSVLSYDTPQDVVNSQDVDALLSLRDALAASDLSFMDSLRWQLGYACVPIGDGTGDLTLVPAYVCASNSLAGYYFAVSAVDGTVLTDAVPTEAAFPALTGGAAATDTPQTTPIPLPQSSPTPAPAVVDLEVLNGDTNYVEVGDHFSLPAGQSIDLYAVWYPQVISATPEWTVDDQSIVSIEPDGTGIHCLCQMVGPSGTETVLHVKVNEKQRDIRITIG